MGNSAIYLNETIEYLGCIKWFLSHSFSRIHILKALPPGGNWKHYFLILFPNLLNGILNLHENIWGNESWHFEKGIDQVEKKVYLRLLLQASRQKKYISFIF